MQSEIVRNSYNPVDEILSSLEQHRLCHLYDAMRVAGVGVPPETLWAPLLKSSEVF